MCGFPTIKQSKKSQSSSKHKKATIRLHTSPTAHLSIASLPNSITITTTTAPPPRPKSTKPAPAPVATYPAFITCLLHPSSFPHAQTQETYSGVPYFFLPYPPTTPQSHLDASNAQTRSARERRRSSLFSEIEFVRAVEAKLAPGPAEHLKRAETEREQELKATEKKLRDEMEGMRREWREKDRKEEVERRVRRGWERGLREGMGYSERAGEAWMDGWEAERDADRERYGSRAHDSRRARTSIPTAGVGVHAQHRRRNCCSRSRSRCRSRDGMRCLGRAGEGEGESEFISGRVYMVEEKEGRGRKASLGEITGGIDKIEEMVGRIHRRVVDADFERDLERLRAGRYAGRI